MYLNGPVLAPMSGRPCACYLLTFEESESGSWVPIRDSGGEDFLLDDGTGRARVVTQSMNVVAVSAAKRTSGTRNDTPQLTAYLAKRSGTTSGSTLDSSMRYQEVVFEVGDTVTVVGVVGFERDPGGVPDGSSYREAPQRAVIAAPRAGPCS